MSGMWIWQNAENRRDEYVDFVDVFEVDDFIDKNSLRLDISVSGDYIVWLNGKKVGYGQYRDYEHYKIKDTLDVVPYIKNGKNRLCIKAWHTGGLTFTNAIERAGLYYSVYNDEMELACSNENTLCRISKDYISHRQEMITPQLGYTYHYDANREDDWLINETEGFVNATISNICVTELLPRPIKKLQELAFLSGKVVQQGVFFWTKGEDAADRMMHSALAYRDENSIIDKQDGVLKLNTDEEVDGVYLIIDLEKEDVGNLYFDIETDEETWLYIGYGEHLAHGRVATKVGVRNFYVGYKTKKGRQEFCGDFRRFGLRYLTIFVCGKDITIHKIGITPLRYPLTKIPFTTGNYLQNKIYETSVRTLELCMHEAYEDCPWREQSFYNMDSRNQMLCGYYAFHEYAFVRAALELVSHGVREDGLLSIVFPAGSDLPIPSFNLIVFTQFKEYLLHSGDKEFVEGKLQFLQDLMQTFLDRLSDDELLPNFPEPCWNFYEWTPTLQGALFEEGKTRGYECPLSAFLSFALGEYVDILEILGRSEKAETYRALQKRINSAIRMHFYIEKDGLFKNFSLGTAYSVLVNALCVLCGANEGIDNKAIEKALKGEYEGEILACTLSMEIFRYEALLKLNEANANFILKDIDENYYAMLSKGATTFWETAKGYADFGNAGSLCHGWSALPVYYYHKLKNYL